MQHFFQPRKNQSSNAELKIRTTDISHYRRLSDSFCYMQTVFRLNWLTAHASYEVTAAVEGDK
jgi:hypothetical protein